MNRDPLFSYLNDYLCMFSLQERRHWKDKDPCVPPAQWKYLINVNLPFTLSEGLSWRREIRLVCIRNYLEPNLVFP
jgi:hypothetical protein